MKALLRVLLVVTALVLGISAGFPGISRGMSGDVNNDKTVNVFDALLVLQNAVGLYVPPDTALFRSAADVAPLDVYGRPKGDTAINVFDALAILRHAVSLDPWDGSAATGETYGIGNFSVTVAGSAIPTGATPVPVATADSAIPPAMAVQSYEKNVTSGAQAYTLKIGAGFHTSTVGTVRLEVPFDRAAVPDQTRVDSLHLLIRIYNADDTSVVDLTGQIVADRIVADLSGFPSAATVTVLYNPHMAVVTSDQPAAKSAAKSVALTSETWATRNWAVVYDAVAVAAEVQKFLGLSAPPTADQLARAVKQQVADHAADAAASYDADGFRSPTLYVARNASEPGGAAFGANPRYLLHFQVNKSNSFYPDDPQELLTPEGNHYGRIYIKDATINRTLAATGGTIFMAIAHELFHAVQAGYDLLKPSIPLSLTTFAPSNLTGVVEGTATAYGVLLGLRHDGASASIPQVRQWRNDPAMIRAETFKLENYLLTANGTDAYANQDFFVYLARVAGDNTYAFLATVFEQLRLTIEDLAATQPTPAARATYLSYPPLDAVYKGLDMYFSGVYGATLTDVYEDFATQRAVEHDLATQFGRPGETTDGLAPELFTTYPNHPGMKDLQIDAGSAGVTTVSDLAPLNRLSARALRLRPRAGSAKGDITITVTPNKGAFDSTVSGWLYRTQSATSARTVTPLQATNTVTAFGADSGDEVIIILFNPTYDVDGVGVTCEIERVHSQEQRAGTFARSIPVATLHDTTELSLVTSGNWTVNGKALQQDNVSDVGADFTAAHGTSGQVNIKASASLSRKTEEFWVGGERYVYTWHEPEFPNCVVTSVNGSATGTCSGTSDIQAVYSFADSYDAGRFEVGVGVTIRYDLDKYDKNGKLISSEKNLYWIDKWPFSITIHVHQGIQ